MASVFFDTNILVYSVDEADPQKREIALSLIAKHAIAKDAAISAQVLQEFDVASTRRLGINPIEARQLVKDFQMFELVQVTPGIIDEAIDRSILDQISFWDGLILSAAKLSRCEKLYSEDMNHGQAFVQARLVEPSGEGFYWFALGAVLIGGIIVAGRGRGKLRAGGGHLKVPNGTPLANLWLAQAQALGLKRDRFADSTAPLGQVLA